MTATSRFDAGSDALHDRFPTSRRSWSEEQQPFLTSQVASSGASASSVQSDDDNDNDTTHSKSEEQQSVSWSSLPNKGQLAVIVLARSAEPLSERSFTSYFFYQLRWFDPSLSDSMIAYQAGILTAVFAAAQCATAMWWGRAADNPRLGRKSVLLIGLVGTIVSVVGMAFSKSFSSAVLFRCLAGALNGNVGVLRTMISEVVPDKRYQTRAFLLLPMCFNIGVIIGPILGGWLADPVTSLPGLFGPDSTLGGEHGVAWMTDYPYALPNLVNAIILIGAASGVFLGLDETHPSLRHRQDYGRKIGTFFFRTVFHQKTDEHLYTPINGDTELGDMPQGIDNDDSHVARRSQPPEPDPSEEIETASRRSYRFLCTSSVVLTMLQHYLQALHVSAFNATLFIMLPSPRSSNADAHRPFLFTGGLELSAKKVGLANTIIGFAGIPFQIILYPSLSAKLGILPSYRVFLPLSALAYCMLPFLVLLPDKAAIFWPCLVAILSSHVLARAFVNPATVILVNRCAPNPHLLGTVHGLAQSVSSAARMLGPTLGGAALGWGLRNNCVGAPFWGMAIIAVINWCLIWCIRNVD